MGIELKLHELLGKRRMTQKELAEKTGIRPATIHAMYHNKAIRVELNQIERICNVLDCEPGDLIILQKE